MDVFLVKTGGANQRAIQEGLKIKALTLSLTKQFIKGDVDTDPKGFDGLQVRCTGDQFISCGATSATAAALSLSKLDEVIDAVDEPTHLIMNKTMRRRLSQAARVSTVGGYITYDLDAFGRRVTRYNDVPILIADKDEDNQDILPFTEAGGGDSVLNTSIYCVSFAENGVMGLQSSEMDVRDLGEQQSKPVYRTRVEWYITLAILRPLAAARLYGIYNAAVTA